MTTATKSVTGTASRNSSTQWVGYLYITPLFLFLGVFVFFGVVYNLTISLYEWNGISEKVFVGLDNYVALFSDPKFFEALSHTVQFLVICIPGSMALGLIFAVLLHGTHVLTNVFKSIYFLPYVIAIVTIGVTFQGIYEPNFGLLNQILRWMGLDMLALSWLSDSSIAIYAIMAAWIFSHVGFYLLIYYTSLLNIDQEIFEAARMDGANVFLQFTKIILPLLKGSHVTLLILGVISALKVFDLVWIMTEGGPAGSTELMSTFLFRTALLEYKTGYSAAISVVLLMIGMIYTVFQLRVYYKMRGH
jgi:raffinose/stachyose/melibiose transport system permease protein